MPRSSPDPAALSARDARAPVARPDLVAWLLLLGLGAIWGASFATTGAAVKEIPPFTVAATRLAIAAALLIPLAYVVAGGLPDRRTAEGRAVWRAALAVAFVGNALPFSLLSWAQTVIPSGLAGVFMASLPLVALPLAAMFVPGETLSREKVTGFLIGFAGVAVLIGADTVAQVGGGGAIALFAQFACLAAASGYAIGSIVTRLSPPAHPVAFGAAAMVLAALMMTPLAMAVDQPWRAAWPAEISATAFGSIVFLGVFPTALAIVIFYEVIRRAGPSFLSLVNYQVPIWAMLFGALWLRESLPPQAPLALLLILGGVALSQGALAATLRRLLGRLVARLFGGG